MASTRPEGHDYEFDQYHTDERTKIESFIEDQLYSAQTFDGLQRTLRSEELSMGTVKINPQKYKMDGTIEYLGYCLQ